MHTRPKVNQVNVPGAGLSPGLCDVSGHLRPVVASCAGAAMTGAPGWRREAGPGTGGGPQRGAAISSRAMRIGRTPNCPRERDGMKWLAPDGDVVARLAPHGVQRALRRNPGGPAMTNGGIDLGRRMSQICILKQDGEIIERRIRTERDRFAAVFKAHPGARILIEAGDQSAR